VLKIIVESFSTSGLLNIIVESFSTSQLKLNRV